MKRRLFVLATTLGGTALVVLTFYLIGLQRVIFQLREVGLAGSLIFLKPAIFFYFLGIIFKLSQLALSGREGTSGLSSSSPLLLPLEVIILHWFSYFYQRGDFLVTPSHFTGSFLEERTRRPYEVVSNGVDLKEFNPGKISAGSFQISRENMI